MATKDISEKHLEAWNDVFADIVNVLLFDGRRLIREDELESDALTVGGYILEHVGNIPKKRESVIAGGFRFTVMEVENQRIMRVVVKKLDSEPRDAEEKE